jgi:arylsulfatase A
VIGKWHLGLGGTNGPDWNGSLRPGPLELGFDDCFILPTTNDRVPQVFVRQDRVEGLESSDPLWVGDKKPSEDHPTGITHRDQLKMNWSHGHNATIHNGVSRIGFYTGGQKARFRDEDLTDHWVAEANRWISEHQKQPFFLLLCSHAIHVPRVVHERYQGKSGHGPRGDAILELDDSVGAIRQTLKSLHLDRKTLIVFCSDNGPVLDDGYQDDAIEKLGDHDPNGPLRGGKYNVFEAGTRTPMIACWPGTVPSGVSDQILCSIDFAASFAKLAGATVTAEAFPDSVDLSDLMSGKPNAKGRSHLLTQDNGQSGHFALRQGRWKLIRTPGKKATNVELRLVPTPLPELQLFDLESDLGESRNVIEQHPDIAISMKRKLEKLLEEPIAQ